MQAKKVLLESMYKNHQPWFDCHITSMRDVLHYYGTNLSPYKCFGIGGGISFNYIPIEASTKCNNPPVEMPFWVIMGSNVTYVDICHEFNVKPHIYRFTDSEEAWQQTKKFIDNKHPVLIDIVDLFLYKEELGSLNELPFFKNMFSQVQVPEFINFLTSGSKNLIIGYDDENKMAKMIFTILITPIDISTNILAKLRSEIKAYPPVYNETVVFDVPTKTLPINYLILKGISKCCMRMLDYSLYIQNTDGRAYNQGLSGMKQFFGDLNNITEIIPDKKILKNTFFVSTMLSRGFANRWGAYRYPYGTFLKESSVVLGNKKIKTIGDNYIMLAEKWTTLMDIIGESILMENFGLLNEKNTRNMMQFIMDEEERNIVDLYNEVS